MSLLHTRPAQISHEPSLLAVRGWDAANWAAPAVIGGGPHARASVRDVVTAYPSDGVWIVECPVLERSVADKAILGILLALAESPRGVVGCFDADPSLVEGEVLDELADLGRYVEFWPGTPIVVASADPSLAAAIRRRPHGDRLAFAPSLLHGWTKIRAVEPPREEAALRIPPHPVAGRLAARFGSRTCRQWGAEQAAGRAGRILLELASSALDATEDDIEVLLELRGDRVHVGLRSSCPEAVADPDGGSGLVAVRTGTGADGVPTTTLPLSDGRTVTWAVLDA